jgi:hypothetical protein
MIIIRILISHESRSQEIWHPPQKFLECAPLIISKTVYIMQGARIKKSRQFSNGSH